MGEVVVRTSDFSLAYRLLAGLKARQVRCAHLERDAPLPPSARVWIATHEEVAAAADPLGIGASLESRLSSAWDGRDQLGQIVPPGTYIMHIEVLNPATGETHIDAAPIVVGVKN